MTKIHARLFLCASLLVMWNTPVRADVRQPAEYEVKAAFLYNFAKFIAWPGRAGANRPFVVGLIGTDPFGTVLDDAMRGQSVQSRTVVIRRFSRIEDIGNCDILFVASSERAVLPRILAVLSRAPVLTVGDMDRFAERGGMINLTMDKNRVRFDINVAAMTRAGLRPGSQLLRLARLVSEAESR